MILETPDEPDDSGLGDGQDEEDEDETETETEGEVPQEELPQSLRWTNCPSNTYSD